MIKIMVLGIATNIIINLNQDVNNVIIHAINVKDKMRMIAQNVIQIQIIEFQKSMMEKKEIVDVQMDIMMTIIIIQNVKNALISAKYFNLNLK